MAQITSFSETTRGILDLPSRGGPIVRLVGDAGLASSLADGRALDQLSELSGCAGVEPLIVGFPNLREGEGFPSGCVIATGTSDAPLIPAGVGAEINCGIRLMASHLREDEVKPHLERLMDELTHQVHVGDDRSGPLNLSQHEIEQVLDEGCRWLVGEKRFGKADDLEVLEEEGYFRGASAGHVPAKARQSAGKQLGTLSRGGSHFVEVDVIDRLYDADAAARLKLSEKQVVCQIHASARELGREVFHECMADAEKAMTRLSLRAPRPQLAWAPMSSKEGERCYLRLLAAQNFGLANRHVIAQLVREAFHLALRGAGETALRTIADTSNNTVHLERFNSHTVCVHRRGASPAHEPGHRAIPPALRDLGQPVLLAGSMGSYSYLMVSSGPARELAWASAPHGAGRALSRHDARRRVNGADMVARMAEQGIALRYSTERSVAEEAPEAYRDAGTCAVYLQRAGIALPVAQLRPIAVLKA